MLKLATECHQWLGRPNGIDGWKVSGRGTNGVRKKALRERANGVGASSVASYICQSTGFYLHPISPWLPYSSRTNGHGKARG